MRNYYRWQNTNKTVLIVLMSMITLELRVNKHKSNKNLELHINKNIIEKSLHLIFKVLFAQMVSIS